MQTIETSHITPAELDILDRFAEGDHVGPELRDVLLALSGSVRAGAALAIFDEGDLTPAEAAARLGMSRTHLYKLLDRGEIVFHRVGRDRRIRVQDLLTFEHRRQEGRRELAERFARLDGDRADAVREIADLL